MKQFATIDQRPAVRLAAACAASGLLLLGAAPAAIAGTYPPSEPTATSTTVNSGAPASPAGTGSPTEDTEVLGERFSSGNGSGSGAEDSALPRTGTEIAQAVGVSAALLAGGAGLVVMGRRSRTRQH